MPQDQLFKELLQSFFREFIELFYPDVAAQLDFGRGVTFLDKETFTDFPEGSRREADIVARVYMQEGEPELILIHIEVQTQRRGEFPYRMFEYYTLLRLRYKVPVFPIVLYLAPGAGGLVEETHQESLFGWNMLTFRYKAVGLPDMDSTEYQERENPLGPALSALMRSGRGSRVRRRLKIMAQRSLLTTDDARRVLLLNVVDRYLSLNAQEEAEFRILLGEPAFQEVKQMVTVYEQRGIEQGIERGIEQGVEQGVERGLLRGRRDDILLVVRSRFGEAPQKLADEVASISDLAQLALLLQRAATAATVEELLRDE